MTSKANTEIYGLVLSGGKSSRMGEDKGQLTYHQLPQEEHLFELLAGLLPKVYLSKKEKVKHRLPIISDQNQIESPLNGLLSAFEMHPNVAWLIVGCDMPLIDQGDIRGLLDERASDKLATCYLSDDGKPHPLFAIYEPASRTKLKEFARENISPRQFLMQEEQVKCLKAQNDHLRGANTPEEQEELLIRINKV